MIDDDIDAAILNIIQRNFPISSRPYLDIAKDLSPDKDEGEGEGDVFARVQKMRASGIIRRIGANFNSKGLNYSSTLCAAKVPENKLDDFVKVVNSYEGVTHNYLRRHQYNVWFTLIAKSTAELDEQIRQMEKDTQTRIISLPASKIFKLHLSFDVKGTKI